MKTTEDSSPTERCGFVVHVVVAILSIAYTVWVLLAFGGCSSYPPSRILTHILPTTVVCLFFAAPILYAITNASIVANSQSIESLQDSVTLKQTQYKLSSSASKTASTTNDSKDKDSPLPEIIDLGVQEINDLCWKAMRAMETT